MKIRITIEYDPDWRNGGDHLSADSRQKLAAIALNNEQEDWAHGFITTADVQSEGGTVKFEVIP